MVRPVLIDLGDGKKRFLKFEADGILLFEEKNGNRSLFEIVGSVPTLRTVLLLLWAGLVWAEPEMTFEEAKALYNAYHENHGGNYFDLVKPLVEAVEQALIRQKAKPNGHAEESPPKLLTETDGTAPSPSGSEI